MEPELGSTSAEPLAATKLQAERGLEILQWKGKYLMVPTEEGIAVVHIRRAQLRIQYERFLKAQENATGAVTSQVLLIPEDITLTQPEVLALLDAREPLAAMGMELEQNDD